MPSQMRWDAETMTLEAAPLVLVADVGGTNTRAALARGPQVLTETVKRYRNAQFPGLAEVLRCFLEETGGAHPVAACVAVAGPVRDGVAVMTNLDWRIASDVLADQLRLRRATVLNDLQAQGHALGALPADRIRRIVAPAAPGHDPKAPRLVVGLGTGFNATVVTDGPAGRVATASECGHMRLPVASPLDFALAQALAEERGFASVEDALSGRGLVAIHRFLASRDAGGEEIAPWDAAAIMAACADGSDPHARAAVRMMCRILGGVSGDLALVHLAFGGVFLVGGVARALTPYLNAGDFVAGFHAKGRFAPFMQQFAVSVIQDDYAALSGCAAQAAAAAGTVAQSVFA